MGDNNKAYLLATLIIVFVRGALGTCIIEMKFNRYSDTCREDINRNRCDPKFTFCLDRARNSVATSPCYYGRAGQSGYFQDTNVIDMSSMTSIKGIPNPWIVETNKIMDSSIRYVCEVIDDDIFEDDYMISWGVNLMEPIYPSANEAVWSYKQLTSDSYSLQFQVRIYCKANYYSGDCTKYCLATDSSAGHYTCDKLTGNKICMTGWTGENCDKDIDECALNYCVKGRCENFLPGYTCYCSPHYSGKNCSIRGDPCEGNACSNNATCTPLEDMSYACNCVGEWEGSFCNDKISPCKSVPCQNGMECISSEDKSNYSCICLYPTTGVNCEAILPDVSTTSMNTTTIEMIEANYTSQIGAPDRSVEFQYWHGIIIAIIILIIIIIVILIVCLVMRRRRRRQRQNEHEVNPHTLAFDNNAYSGTRKSNMIIQDADKLSNSPSFIIASETEKKDNDTTDDQGYVRPRPTNSGPYATIEERLVGLQRAVSNPYSGMSGSKSNLQKEQSEEEAHYQDLNEMAAYLKAIDDNSDDDDDEEEDDDKDPKLCLGTDAVLPSDNPTSDQLSEPNVYKTPKSTPVKSLPPVPPKPAAHGSAIYENPTQPSAIDMVPEVSYKNN